MTQTHTKGRAYEDTGKTAIHKPRRRVLRRISSRPHLDFQLPASRTVKK